MSNTQKKVPELRFPGFEGEWEEKKLGELGLFQKSYSFSRAKEGNGKTKHIHYGDIHSKFKTVLDSDGNIPNIIEKAVFELIQKGDIVFADASEDYSDLGKAVMIDFEPNSLISGLHTHLFRPFNNATSNFLIFYTKTLSYKKFIRQQGTGISVLGISKKSLLNLNVLIPRNELEQQKIGQFFSKIDRQIELEEQKLELLQQQKKGYMQKIFSQELRFKDENGNEYPEWEEKKLGEIAEIVRGASPRPIKDSKWFSKESDIGWLRISDVTEQNGKIYHLDQKLSKEGQEKTRVLLSKHLLLSIAASIGKPVMNFVKTGVHDGFLIFLNPKFNLYFMYYWLEYFKDKWSKYGQPGSQVNLNSEIVKSQNIYLPIRNEQQKIGKFFSKIDRQIELEEQKLELLQQQKKALLKSIFI